MVNRDYRDLLRIELDIMTAEIYREFLQTLAIAWLCFGVGAVLWRWRSWATFAGLQHCSKLLLILSPVLLSAFGYRSTEAVRTAEMTTEGTSVATHESKQDRNVPAVRWSSQRNGTSDRQPAANSGRTIASTVRLPQRQKPAGYGSRWMAQASAQQPGRD